MLLSVFLAAVARCQNQNTTTDTQRTTDLCTQMPGMPGCTLRTLGLPLPVVLAALCQDMPSMASCRNYTTTLTSIAPTSRQAAQGIYDSCQLMTMSQCATCTLTKDSTYSNCDLLTTYSKMCLEMDMTPCGAYRTMCATTPDLPLCKQNSDSSSSSTAIDPPPMLMYFHSGYNEYIFLKSFVTSRTSYYPVLVFVFLLAVVSEGLGAFSRISEQNWPAYSICGYGGGVYIALMRALLRVVSSTIGYLLMLLSMTFNVGIFACIIAGFGVGCFIFGSLKGTSTDVATKDCH